MLIYNRAFLFAFITLFLLINGMPSEFAEAVYDGKKRNAQSPAYAPSELIVKFKPGAVKREGENQVEFIAAGLEDLRHKFPVKSISPVFHTASPDTDLGRTYKIVFAPSVDLTEAMSSFKANPSVEYAEPNYLMHTQSQTDEPDSI